MTAIGGTITSFGKAAVLIMILLVMMCTLAQVPPHPYY
jgi:hypothetical protein